MCVFACYVVSKLQRHRCPTFRALRPRNQHGQTGRYIFIYIDRYIKVTSKHARIRLLRCVQIVTPSVPYFRSFTAPKPTRTNWPLHFYIYRWVEQSGFDSQQGWLFFVYHISRPAAGSIQLSVLQSIPLFLFFN
jgi:hypothetical protein